MRWQWGGRDGRVWYHLPGSPSFTQRGSRSVIGNRPTREVVRRDAKRIDSRLLTGIFVGRRRVTPYR